jgi:hypothetical protein
MKEKKRYILYLSGVNITRLSLSYRMMLIYVFFYPDLTIKIKEAVWFYYESIASN